MPESCTICGLPGALSVKVSVPVCVPAVDGSKKTLMVQFTPTARLLVQPLVTPNCALLGWTLDRAKATLPLLVSVMFCGSPVVPTNCAGNVKLLVERLAVGALPVPVSKIVCGVSAALSIRDIVAVRAPYDVGVKVTVSAQLPPAATEFPQVWLSEKSPEFDQIGRAHV